MCAAEMALLLVPLDYPGDYEFIKNVTAERITSGSDESMYVAYVKTMDKSRTELPSERHGRLPACHKLTRSR